MRIHVADVSEVGRNTMGVTVMDVEEGDQVATVDVIPAGTDGETDETDG